MLNPIIITIAALVLGAKTRLSVAWIISVVAALLIERSRRRTMIVLLDRLVAMSSCVQIAGWSAIVRVQPIWVCGCPLLCTHTRKGE